MSTKRKIKVLQITHDLAIGGLQQVVVNICRTINRDKFDISVLCLRTLGEFVPAIEKMGIEVQLLPQKENATDYLSFLKVARILKEKRPDVIHTHNTQPFIDGTIAAMLAGVKTVVHTDHARSFPDKRRYMFAEWLISHYAYKIVGVSEHTANNLISYEKISKDKLVVIPNGIDGAQFQSPFDPESKKRELGISNTGPIIGLGVRLSEQKGITYLLQAMPALVAEFPSIILLIAGSGPLEETLKSEAEQLGVNNNVHFLGPRLDLNEIIRLFDVYVLPSLWEGLPMVLLEAMAAGLPIVATDVGGVATAVHDGQNGLLVTARNPDLLASSLIRLLRNESWRRDYGSFGRRIFDGQFSARIMTEKYERLYERRIGI